MIEGKNVSPFGSRTSFRILAIGKSSMPLICFLLATMPPISKTAG